MTGLPLSNDDTSSEETRDGITVNKERHRISASKGASTTHEFALANGLGAKLADSLSAAVSVILQHLSAICSKSEKELIPKSESGQILIDIFFPAPLIPLDVHHEEKLPSWIAEATAGIDRVYVGRQGHRKVIRLVMYPRNNSSEAWFMGLSPSLKDTAKRTRIETGENAASSGTVIEDTETGKVLRLDQIDDFLVSGLNGSIPLREIYMKSIDQFGLISPDRIGHLYQALENNGMLKTSTSLKGDGSILNKLRRFVEEGFVLRRSNQLLGSLLGKLGRLVGALGVILLSVIGVSSILMLILNDHRFISVVHDAGPYLVHHPLILIALYIFVFLTTIMHELGHGLTCRHYGGRVDRMGFMLYLVMFIFFCDVSTTWSMKNRWHRILVSLGGPLVTFGILGGCLWGFKAVSGTGSPLEIFFVSAAMMEVFVLVMNLNPFLRMDAYYILEDALNVSNLRKNSFSFWEKMIFRNKASGENISTRNRSIFLLYGLLGGVITIAVTFYYLYSYLRELLMHQGSEGKIVFAAFMVLLLLIRFGMKTSSSLRSRTHWSREVK